MVGLVGVDTGRVAVSGTYAWTFQGTPKRLCHFPVWDSVRPVHAPNQRL